MTRLLVCSGLGVVLLLGVPRAHATHVFVEEFDEAGVALGGAADINEEITLFGVPPRFLRDPLTGTEFLPEPLLPVSTTDVRPDDPEVLDKELLWDNGPGDQETLAMTPDTADGNYPFLRVRMETVFSTVGDLVPAEPRAGVVVRFSQNRFYAAYGMVELIDGFFLAIHFHLQKWNGSDLIDLDSGPAFTVPFGFSAGDNYRIRLVVTAPDGTGTSQLTARVFRLSVTGGSLIEEDVAVLEGSDDDLNVGRIGLYAKSGSAMSVFIGFDDSSGASLLDLREGLIDLDDLIATLDISPDAGDLTGPSIKVNGARKRKLERKADRMFKLLDAARFKKLARKLQFVRKHADGTMRPRDWVQGEAAARMVAVIDQIQPQLPP